MYEAPIQTVPNRIALNWAMQSLTKAYFAKSSCVDKKENRSWLNLMTQSSFLDNFLNKQDTSGAISCSVFMQRNT
jgi:hypothetical protein